MKGGEDGTREKLTIQGVLSAHTADQYNGYQFVFIGIYGLELKFTLFRFQDQKSNRDPAAFNNI